MIHPQGCQLLSIGKISFLLRKKTNSIVRYVVSFPQNIDHFTFEMSALVRIKIAELRREVHDVATLMRPAIHEIRAHHDDTVISNCF